MLWAKKLYEVEAGDEVVVEGGGVVTAISCPVGEGGEVWVATDGGVLVGGWDAAVVVQDG